MRKVLSFILITAVAVLGVFALIEGVQIFSRIDVQAEIVRNDLLAAGIADCVLFSLSILIFFGSLGSIFSRRRGEKILEIALIDLAIFTICEGVGLFANWDIATKGPNPDAGMLTLYCIAWIIAFSAGALLLLASLPPIHSPIRRIFGVVGALVGVITFGLASSSLNGSAPVTNWVIIIGGLIASICGILLSAAIKDKR